MKSWEHLYHANYIRWMQAENWRRGSSFEPCTVYTLNIKYSTAKQICMVKKT